MAASPRRVALDFVRIVGSDEKTNPGRDPGLLNLRLRSMLAALVRRSR
jgi:hypothetical protein